MKIPSHYPALSLLTAAFLLSAPALHAALKTWDGSTSGNWNTSANWSGAVVPVAGDDLTFPIGGASKTMTNNLAGGLAFQTLSFAEGGYSIAGNPFTLTADVSSSLALDLFNNPAGTTTIMVPVTLATRTCSFSLNAFSTLTFTAASGVALGGQSLTLLDTGNINMLGPITGAGAATALSKTGTGTLVLGAAINSYTGATLFNAGEVVLNGSLSGGGAVTVGDNASLLGNNGVIAGPVAMNGTLNPGSATAGSIGKLTFSNNLTFSSTAGDTRTVVFDLTSSAATPGTSYDQIVCNGTVTAGTARLTFNGTGVPALGTEFILISKSGAVPISGTFHDSSDLILAEGAIKSVGLVRMRFSYAGGDGNDFSATVVPVTATAGNKTWDDSAADVTDHNFSTGDNWAGNIAPVGGNTLIFGTAAPPADRALTKNDTGGHFYEIQFTDTGYNITPESLTNQDVTLSNGITATATASGTNTWSCDLHLAQAQTFSNLGSGTMTISATLSLDGQDLTLRSDNAGAAPVLRINGLLDGTGRITKTGADLVDFSGSGFTNWGHTGEVQVDQGELRITRSTGIAPALVVQGPVTIGGAGFTASLTTTVAEKILDTVGVTVNTGGTFAPGAAETIGSLTLGGGAVNSGAFILAVNGNITANENATIPSPLQVNTPVRTWTVAAARTLTMGGALTYSPLTSGTSVLKQGTGTLVLSGTSQVTTFSADAGILQLDINSLTETIGVLVNGGTLTGSGQAVRITSSATGGTVSPGTGTGTAVLKASRLTMNSATTAAFDLNGTTAGSGYDQIDVASLPGVDATNNTVTLANAALVLRDTVAHADGSVFIIIRNDATDAVIGTFAGLAQGATIRTSLNQYIISYTGGTGNDVTLTSVQPTATGVTKVWSGAGVNSSWSNAANWTGGVAPVAGDSLEFPGTAARLFNGNDLPANMTFNRISYTGAAPSGAVTITGNALRLLQNFECGWTGPAGSLTFNPPLTLEATSATVQVTGTRTLALTGSVTAHGSTVVFSGDGTAAQHAISLSRALTIAGSGALIVRNNASLGFSGTDANAFGTTTVEFGRVTSVSAIKIPGALILGNGTDTVTTDIGGNTMAAGFPVTVNANAAFRSGTNSLSDLTINGGTLDLTASLTVQGNVTVNSGTVTTANGFVFTDAPANHSITVATGASLDLAVCNGGAVQALDLLQKAGGGLLKVRTSLSQWGGVNVDAGTLQVDATGASPVVLRGGSLTGSGAIANFGATAAGGTIAPGASPGRLTTGFFNFRQEVTLALEVGGTLPGTTYDQFVTAASGAIDGCNLTMALTGGYVPLTGQVFRLLDNQGATPLSGLFRFAGSPVLEGTSGSLGGGVTVQFSYVGGTGNDFTATVTASPAGAFRVWDGGGADANWMTAANWTGDIAPLPMEALRFPGGALQTTNSNNFPVETIFNGLKIEAAYTLGGNSLTLAGDVDVQSPGTVTIGTRLFIDSNVPAIKLSGASNLTLSGGITFDEVLGTGGIILRNSGSGALNVSGTIGRTNAQAGLGVIVEGGGIVQYSAATNNDYPGETWVKHGVLQLISTTAPNTVPGNLRIGGAGFTASVENPGGSTNGLINNLANLIVETGGTHIMTGANPIERIARLIMRGGSLVQPVNGQLIALDRIHAEGNVASTITTPVYIEASSASDIDLILVEDGSTLTFAANSGYLFGGATNPKLRKTGAGPLVLQASLTADELDCWEGTVVTSGASGLINGRTVLNGGTVTGNGLLNGLVSGVAAGVPAGSPGGGILTPSGPAGTGTGTGLLTCAGNFLPATQTHVAIEIGGLTAGTQHDQLQVNNILDLNRCFLDLSLVNGFVPTAGQTFTIVNLPSGAGPTPRPFAGKDEGVTFTAAGQLWKLTYVGGSNGNDIILTAQGPAPTLNVTSFSFGPPPGGAAGNQITATVTGPASTLVNLEASSDLGGWTIIGSATTSGAGAATFNLTDAAAGPRRFYRFSIL